MANLKTRILTAAAVFFALNAIGTLGYLLISNGQATPLDAFFMTVTTLASVGFGEITPHSNGPAGRLFTIVLIYSGMVTLVFVTTSLTAFFVGGEMTRMLEKRRMSKRLEAMKEHFIVCGVGTTGIHVVRELVATARPLVFIEATEERANHVFGELKETLKGPFDHVAFLVGDATDDLILGRAGIERARGMVVALPSDKDNLFITIAARQLNPQLRIIARASAVHSIDKLKRAGAQSVVSPNMIGGLRMVSELVRPSVVTFLDLMLRDKDKAMRIEEVTICSGSAVCDKTLAESQIRQAFHCSVLAVRTDEGAAFDYNPRPETALKPGMVLIVLGSADEVGRLRAAVAVA